jgi:Protein of unknown function (DUF3515)
VCGCLLLAACSGPVEVDSPDVDAGDRAACEGLVDDLPATLSGEDPVETEPKDPLGAAYGDPAIIVVCGVDVPEDFNETSACEEANKVGWYAPPEQYDDQSADVTIFAVTHRPVVELRMPSDYRPAGLAAALAELAAPVKRNLEKVQDCV